MCCRALREARQDNLCNVKKTTRLREEGHGLQKPTTLILHMWQCTQVSLEMSIGRREKQLKSLDKICLHVFDEKSQGFGWKPQKVTNLLSYQSVKVDIHMQVPVDGVDGLNID